ncbi:MAG: hypothetical protein QXL15_01555, partial [Candidatus Korarchaeota archaeon]
GYTDIYIGREMKITRCPKCNTEVVIEEEESLEDILHEKAIEQGTKIMFISDNFEEGIQLRDGFGGLAALLRYQLGY